MAENEPIAKRLTEQLSTLKARAGAMKDPKNADRVLIINTLALLAEGVAKLNRDVSELKKKGKSAGAGKGKGPGAKGPGAKGPGAKGPGAKGPGAAAIAGAGGNPAGGRGGPGKPKGKGANLAKPA